MKHADLQEFLRALPPPTREVVSALRTVIRRTAPDAEESL
jgi:hypothetical protein